jgi:hypothetical protein
MKNGRDIGRGLAYPSHGSTGSINVIINLRKGDVVLLRHWEGVAAETIYGERRSEFVGWLGYASPLPISRPFFIICRCVLLPRLRKEVAK